MTLSPEQEDSRYAAVSQYSLAQILAVWAAFSRDIFPCLSNRAEMEAPLGLTSVR